MNLTVVIYARACTKIRPILSLIIIPSGSGVSSWELCKKIPYTLYNYILLQYNCEGVSSTRHRQKSGPA